MADETEPLTQQIERPHPGNTGPRGLFLKFAALADRWTYRVCLLLLVLMLGAQTLVVVLRYLFSIGFVELQNLVTYCFAAFCVLVVPLALRADRHVRVDVLRGAMDVTRARRWDMAAIILLLFPVFGYGLWSAMPMVLYSWSILEGSRDTGGLPGYFIVLTALPLMCALLVIQGLAILLDRQLIHAKSDGDDA